jgi:hypothetical protein
MSLRQSRPVRKGYRTDGWNFVLCKISNKAMLFKNLLSGPSTRPIELDDPSLSNPLWVFDFHVIDPILKTIQSKASPGARDPRLLD